VKRRIFQLAEQTPEWKRNGLKDNVAHDHSQKLITAKKLPQPMNIRVPFYDEDEDGPKAGGKEYVLTLEFSGDLDMQNLHKCAVLHECLAWLTVRSLVIWRVLHNIEITISCPSFRL
jgi:hypothetical protein